MGAPETDESRAHETALRAITKRPLSRAQVAERLARRGFEESVCERVLERLERAGLLDDRALAERLIEEKTRRAPAGRLLLERELEKRGVRPEDASSAIGEAIGDAVDEHDRAMTLARERLASMPAGLDDAARARRLFGLLARRGFDETTAEEAVRCAMDERRTP